ncbi:flagellar hook protein FlgE [Phenylobacterium sp.]|jgi:flagellar hook protein FlgE|uniref:flagellar hook protein FlgE n=1 Tax=Phenylobacterium sp. TaxID=1871053 RepID=UPI002E2F1748|nr:flagellar hook protein FlgE [Phenylobacterium sp.]HEX4713178.1 flagellar hook protein FlgE [Phenylobacterium sp.]
MSVNSALQAGVSGLAANASALAAISDNIANLNTTAYKRNEVDFATMVTSQAVKGEYSAGGVLGSAKQLVSQQGQIQSASSSTSLAITGDGFFVVSTKGAGLTATDPREFTRSGAFSPDASGYLVNDAGLYLQGWPVQANGTFSINPSDLSQMGPINVKNLGAAVQPTSTVTISANLDQTTPVGAGAAGYVASSTTKSMASYAATGTGTPPDAPPVEISVVDSMGGTHKFAVAFEKTSTPNTWNAEIYAVPASDVTTAATSPNGQIAAGVVKFNTDGSIDLANSTLFGSAGATPTITLGASTAATTPAWAAGLGIAGQSFNVDLSQFSQLASASTVTSVSSNGASAGNIVGVQVGTDGVVSAVFDNSQVRKIAQVAIATFPNANGLQATNGNAYTATLASGQMTLKAPGAGGAGKISPSSLEASTVDLSTEFTGLITTQKAYSASSKIITTADTMLDELINIIR